MIELISDLILLISVLILLFSLTVSGFIYLLDFFNERLDKWFVQAVNVLLLLILEKIEKVDKDISVRIVEELEETILLNYNHKIK